MRVCPAASEGQFRTCEAPNGECNRALCNIHNCQYDLSAKCTNLQESCDIFCGKPSSKMLYTLQSALTSCIARMRRSATAVARVVCVRSLAAGVKVAGAGGTPSRLGCRSTTVPAVDTAQHRSTYVHGTSIGIFVPKRRNPQLREGQRRTCGADISEATMHTLGQQVLTRFVALVQRCQFFWQQDSGAHVNSQN